MNADNFSFDTETRVHTAASNRVYFNGKFLTAAPTGVHRVAEELIVALDHLLKAEPSLATAFDFTLVYPKDVRRRPVLTSIRDKCAGLFTWIPWEQIDLPRLTVNGLCVSLCNLGPLVSRNAITMMHDAQVYSSPASYSFAFRLWYKSVQPFMGWHHKRILTVSDFSKTELVRYGVARADKIAVVHNGCDHVLRVTPDRGAVVRHGLEDQPYVLSLSNTQHHKNISVLLAAFHAAKLQNVTLALFGGASKADFEALGFAVPGNVRFLGRISDGELSALMTGAAAFACPSLTEGFGLPPLEAMLLGCPSIIAPCGALPEVCGDAALVADPHAPDEWAKQISRLIEDKALHTDMRAKGYAHAGKFTWERAARQLLRNIADVENRPLPVSRPVGKTHISMVMSTLGRIEEVRNFLETLTVGRNQDIEVIIVDENDDIDLAPVINSREWPFKVIHKKVPGIRGSSRGRNIGIAMATGDIICFPDDDCIYPPRLLENVIRTFAEQEADIVCGRPSDEEGRSINGRFALKSRWVRKEAVFMTQTEWLLFFRRETLAALDGFDEDIGLGASTPWQSAEGQDLTLKALEMGRRVYYDPALIGHHPQYNIANPDAHMLNRARKYGRGMGYVLGIHRFSALTLVKMLLRPLLGSFVFASHLNFRRAQYYTLSALGRCEGYIDGIKRAKQLAE
jgi:glycosyltransferase involved in cell wall biosynthesis